MEECALGRDARATPPTRHQHQHAKARSQPHMLFRTKCENQFRCVKLFSLWKSLFQNKLGTLSYSNSKFEVPTRTLHNVYMRAAQEAIRSHVRACAAEQPRGRQALYHPSQITFVAMSWELRRV